MHFAGPNILGSAGLSPSGSENHRDEEARHLDPEDGSTLGFFWGKPLESEKISWNDVNF